jgi:hypothetical protein
MPTKQKTVNAPAVPHTGVVWSARFEKPGKKFLQDFSWVIYDTKNPQINYPFSAYMMLVHENGDLEIRFNDLSHPPVGKDADVTASIRSPNST